MSQDRFRARRTRPEGFMRAASIVSLLAAGIGGVSSSFFDLFRLSGRTFQLVPASGPGFTARLSVNLFGYLMVPVLAVLGGIGVFRRTA